MIEQTIYLYNWDWTCKVYYADVSYDRKTILNSLINIGCKGDTLYNMKEILDANRVNEGFTYVSPKYRSAVMFIGRTSSADEFQSTYDHEKGHLAKFISLALDINPYGEEYQYLAGDIGIKTFKIAKHFLCDTCRRRMFKSIKSVS